METGPVEKVVRVVRLRIGRNVILQTQCRTLFWGAVAFAIALPVHRLLSPPFSPWWLALGAFLGAVAAGAFLAVRGFPSRLRAAVAADQAFGLEDEVSSAFILRGAVGSVAAAFRERAREVAARLKPGGRFPFRAPLEGKILPLPVIASGLIFLLVPDMDILGLLRSREEEKETRRDLNATAWELAKRARALRKKSEALSFESAKQVVEDMEQVADLLRRHVADEKEALARLADLKEKLEKQRSKDGRTAGKKAFKPKSAASKSESEMVRKIHQAYKKQGKIGATKELFGQLKSIRDAFSNDGMTAEEMAGLARELKMIVRSFNLPPEIMEKLQKLMKKMEAAGKGGGEKKYEVPPPELDFTMEELLELLKRLEEEDFLDEALQKVDETRQGLIEKLKLCPYCKKGLKHPWEGGTPLPGMGPDGEPGVGYI